MFQYVFCYKNSLEIQLNLLRDLNYILLIFLIIDMTSISTKYVNKSIITFEINNVRNPQLKKLVRFFDNVYSQLFFYLSKNQKKNFSIKTELHQQFPDEILVEGIKSGFTLSNFNDKNNF